MPYPVNLNTHSPMSPEYRGRNVNQEALAALQDALTAFRAFERAAKRAECNGADLSDTLGWLDDMEAEINIQIDRIAEGEE